MTVSDNRHIAEQYLVWALEEISNPKAANYIRLALNELRDMPVKRPAPDAEEEATS